MSDDAILKEIRERFDYAATEWQEIRAEARKDMRFVAGDPWEDEDRAQRKGRPTIAPEEMGQYFNQVINDIRANPRGIKFSPADNDAIGTQNAKQAEQTAQFYEGKARETEYRSNAMVAYVAAAENAIQRSYGYCRLNTRFASDRSFNQDAWIEPIPNPDQVLPDPDFVHPDLSDIRYLFYYESRTEDEFKREFPRARITSFSKELVDLAPKWLSGNKVQIAEYWTKERKERTLLLLRGPQGEMAVFEDELVQRPSKDMIVKERTVETDSVVQYLTNGVEILKRTPWPGKYIPFAACFGKILYVDEGAGARRKILSMTRFGRDPWKAFCYACSSQLEVLGMTPKVPVAGYKGQFRGHEKDWARAAHEPMAYLEFEGTTEGTGQQLLPPPMRIDYPAAQHLQALEIVKEGFRRSIQAAMATNFLPTQAQRRNEKSGVALQRMEDTAQQGSFHFKDNFNGMVRHVGVMFEDLCDKIYDTARDVGIRKADDTSEIVRINDPQNPKAISTKGSHLVTVSTGPRSDSQREEAGNLIDRLTNVPELFARVADLAIKLKAAEIGPLADQIAERLTPPEYRKPDGDPQQQLAEAMQMIEQFKQQMQALSAELQERVKQIEMDTAKQEAETERQALKLKHEHDLQVELQEMKNATTIRVAEITAAIKGYQTEAQHAAQHEEQALNIAAAAVEGDLEREQSAHEAERDRQHQAELADRQVVGKLAVEAAKPKPANGARA